MGNYYYYRSFRVTESQLFAPTPGVLSGMTLFTDSGAAVVVKVYNSATASASKLLALLSIPIGGTVDKILLPSEFGFSKLYIDFAEGEGELNVLAYDPGVWSLDNPVGGFGVGGFGLGGFGG